MIDITKVKICAMQSVDDITIAVNCGADAIGFITEIQSSPRNQTVYNVAELISYVPIFVNSVMVIAPESSEQAINYVDICKPNIIQIHNDLSNKEIENIRDNINQQIIKLFSVPVDNFDTYNNSLSEMQEMCDQKLVDAILLDSCTLEKTGGTGIVHNWSISKKIVESLQIPVVLAGGLSSINVEQAISTVSPYAVDVASGVETNGKKDKDKINAFVKAVRGINA